MLNNAVNLVAVLGILGTLGGVLVGAFVTYKIQERQLRHTDETRFHDQRLEVYTTYTKAAILTVSGWLTGSKDDASEREFLYTFEKLRMIGTEPVVQEAAEIHSLFAEMQRAPDRAKIDQGTVKQFNVAVAHFTMACRSELKIGNA